jgi:hypothetical protein
MSRVFSLLTAMSFAGALSASPLAGEAEAQDGYAPGPSLEETEGLVSRETLRDGPWRQDAWFPQEGGGLSFFGCLAQVGFDTGDRVGLLLIPYLPGETVALVWVRGEGGFGDDRSTTVRVGFREGQRESFDAMVLSDQVVIIPMGQLDAFTRKQQDDSREIFGAREVQLQHGRYRQLYPTPNLQRRTGSVRRCNQRFLGEWPSLSRD